jgi:hypothetical protein
LIGAAHAAKGSTAMSLSEKARLDIKIERPPRFFQDAVGKNLLICIKADFFERVHTVKAHAKGERS